MILNNTYIFNHFEFVIFITKNCTFFNGKICIVFFNASFQIPGQMGNGLWAVLNLTHHTGYCQIKEP